ncbi:MAG: cysteine desulfurase-like protein [Prochloraceae cyanobacterium]|nr:cysteine desulfurase-like protein [Prochloraceae cyanobacterium]
MVSLDINWIRNQFPALKQEIEGKPIIFFDGPGGTQVPIRVIEAISEYLKTSNANSHGAFATSMRTDEIIEKAREAMADFLGCDRDEIVFGANMTSLTFAFSRSIAREIQPGDEVVVTRLDHDANVAPWLTLEEKGAVIRVADIKPEDCTLDMTDLEKKINAKTKLIAVGYASNAVGSINDVATVVKLARAVGARVFVDAVHYAPHCPIDVSTLDCDFLACSAYKFFGPHVGVLYGKRQHLEALHPYKVRPASARVPDRWESGTKNHEGLAGVIATIDYISELGRRVSPQVKSRRESILAAMEATQNYERDACEKLVSGLLQIPGLTFYGIKDFDRFTARTPTVSIRIEGKNPNLIAKELGDRGIFTWDGNFYALNLTERLGVESVGGLLRIGLVHYNSAEEINRLLTTLYQIVES